jgi:hypothetical protein
MIRRSGIIAVVLLLLSVLGCARLPSPAEMAEQTKDFKLPAATEAGQAMVYVVRPSMVGTLIRFNVFADDQEAASEMGYTRGSQYIYFTVAPGKHMIYSKAENWAEIAIDAKADDIIFIKQDPQIGFIMARNSLSPLDAVEGKYHVMNTSLGTIIKSKK